MPLWAPIFINLLGLSLIGFLWWAYTGKRLVIFHGMGNRDSAKLSIRMRSHCVGQFVMLVLINMHIFGIVDVLLNQWLILVVMIASGAYYYWRMRVELTS
ncbi:hypothetical protein CCB81_13005 [Armatimonadetes bacterium Uphvl-Ar2]|nr:hypothetical protein CCB81_13005 [Armatimonadetes bacterium Uphvl-Ar2]